MTKNDIKLLAEVYTRIINEAYDPEFKNVMKPVVNQIMEPVQQIAGNVVHTNSFRQFVNAFGRPRYLNDQMNSGIEEMRSKFDVRLQNGGPKVVNLCLNIINRITSTSQNNASSWDDPVFKEIEGEYEELKKLVPNENALRSALQEARHGLEMLILQARDRNASQGQ